jgi:hypothetical protein
MRRWTVLNKKGRELLVEEEGHRRNQTEYKMWLVLLDGRRKVLPN